MSFDDLEIKLALDFATRSLTKREIAVLEERTNLGMFAEIDIDEDFAYAVKKSLPVGSITVDEIYDTLVANQDEVKRFLNLDQELD